MLEKDIMAGCTVSVVLFIMAMNLFLEGGGRHHSHDPVFTRDKMGDVRPVEDWTNWAHMHFKAKKSSLEKIRQIGHACTSKPRSQEALSYTRENCLT